MENEAEKALLDPDAGGTGKSASLMNESAKPSQDCELIIKKQNMVIITYLTKHLSWAQLHHLIDWWGAQIHPSNFFHFTRAKHGKNGINTYIF